MLVVVLYDVCEGTFREVRLKRQLSSVSQVEAQSQLVTCHHSNSCGLRSPLLRLLLSHSTLVVAASLVLRVAASLLCNVALPQRRTSAST